VAGVALLAPPAQGTCALRLDEIGSVAVAVIREREESVVTGVAHDLMVAAR